MYFYCHTHSHVSNHTTYVYIEGKVERLNRFLIYIMIILILSHFRQFSSISTLIDLNFDFNSSKIYLIFTSHCLKFPKKGFILTQMKNQLNDRMQA